MELLFPELLNVVKKEFKNPLFTKQVPVSHEDIVSIEREVNTESIFDRFDLRKKTWKNHKAIVVKQNTNTKIIAILESTNQKVPWDTWFHITNLFGKRNLRVIFLANSTKRQFPNRWFEPGAINGGYTYPCTGNTIVIYREEDATRVLIHELFHFYCTDIGGTVDKKEAETEAWAELVLCAVIAKGNMNNFKELLKIQRGWMEKQNMMIQQYKKENSVWRYTIEKQKVWDRWNIVDGVVESCSSNLETESSNQASNVSLSLGACFYSCIK